MSDTSYPLELITDHNDQPIEDPSLLLRRPFNAISNSFKEDAKRFVPGDDLLIAVNTAIAVGQPLLITGEPGTGKTQAAYYAAYKLQIEPVIHFQVKSDSNANDLLYFFDSVKYFYESSIAAKESSERKPMQNYIEKRALWEAIASETPRILLIDEIDKAPRDFPNDLLLELDKMEFTVTETGEKVEAAKDKRPIVFITSNSERRLPEPFLRRCVYHHIHFNEGIVNQAVNKRRAEYSRFDKSFLDIAIKQFLVLRNLNLRKKPSLGEFLVWLRVLALATGVDEKRLESSTLRDLPYLKVLLKDFQDIEELP
jgi:MoxR-like ATPase